MSTVTVPSGVVPVRSLTTNEILTGNRVTTFRIDLLDKLEQSLGTLDGVTGGHVEWRANAAVKGAVRLDIVDNGQAVDWLSDRIRPVITIDGLDEQPLGVFLFTEAPERWSATGRTWQAGLLDKTTILDQDKVDEAYALDAGTVITTAVVTLIQSTGETSIAVTPSTKTLANPLMWPPGTSKLRIVNDLLDVAGYFALYADNNGQLRGDPYVLPASRPVGWEFLDDEHSIYSPDFVKDVDLFSIPNKVVVTTMGTGDTEALTATATNEQASSPYSFAARGRWIVHPETGVESADQDTLDAYAQRRLVELTSPVASIEIAHAWVPGLPVNAVARLRNVPAGVDARHVVTATTVPFDGTALARSTLREVVAL